MRCCTSDGGRPSGTAFQEEVSNHRKLRWSKVRVVSVTEKARTIASGEIKKVNESEPLMKCRKRSNDIKTEWESLTRDKSGGNLITAQTVSGMKAARA
jgi:hypothetical protein